MLNQYEKNVAIELARGVMYRKNIRGEQLTKHLKSSLGKYNLEFDNEEEYSKFEEVVSKYINYKEKYKNSSPIDQLGEYKNSKAVYVKNIVTNEIYKFQKHKEVSEFIGIRAENVSDYIKNRTVYKRKFLISRSKDFVRKPLDGVTGNISVMLSNLKTGEKKEFDSRSKAAKYLGVSVGSVLQSCKYGYCINKTWKAREI